MNTKAKKQKQIKNKVNTSSIDQAISLFNQNKYQEALKVIDALDLRSPGVYAKSILVRSGIEIRTGNAENGLKLISELESKYGLQGPEIYNLKAVGLRALGRFAEAFDVLTTGHQLHPLALDIAHNLSLTAGDLAKYDLAIEIAKKALAINPEFVVTLKNLSKMYVTLRDVENAKKTFEKIEALEKGSLDVIVGEGAVELIQGNNKKAAIKFEQALKINDQLGPAWANLGICSKFENDYIKAKKYLQKACQVEPDQVEHQWNLALVELALGEYQEGWKNYEIRYDSRRMATDRVVLPKTPVAMLKKTDSIKGKSIVLLQEQGFGDTFQFLRFAKELKEEGAGEVIAIVSKELTEVIRAIPWIDRVQYEMVGEKLPDYWTFPMSLPFRYDVKDIANVPAPIPYIGAENQKIKFWQKN